MYRHKNTANVAGAAFGVNIINIAKKSGLVNENMSVQHYTYWGIFLKRAKTPMALFENDQMAIHFAEMMDFQHYTIREIEFVSTM